MARPIGDQIVVVTGSSSGVGRAIAQAFGAKGARIALLARNRDALEDAADDIQRSGGLARFGRLSIRRGPTRFTPSDRLVAMSRRRRL